jgi:hypothetical protein
LIQYVVKDLLLLILNKSFPKKRINAPIGVRIMKYIIPITIGETIAPKKIPNLIHSLLSGVKNLEFKTPKTKKIKDAIRAQYIISPRDIKGHNDVIKKTMKNKIPKLLFDEIFVLLFKFI